MERPAAILQHLSPIPNPPLRRPPSAWLVRADPKALPAPLAQPVPLERLAARARESPALPGNKVLPGQRAPKAKWVRQARKASVSPVLPGTKALRVPAGFQGQLEPQAPKVKCRSALPGRSDLLVLPEPKV